RRLVSGSADTTALVWRIPAAKPDELTADELADLWKELAGDDAKKAYQAVRSLAASAKAVPFLKANLRPAVADRAGVARLIADVDNEQFGAREDATADLERLGTFARPALRKALANKPTAEACRRIEGLMERMLESQLEGVLPPEQLRAARALEALEHSGSPEARRVLAALAR